MPSPQWECSSWLEGGCCSGFGNLSDHSRGVAVLAFLTRRCWLAWTVDQRSQSPEPVGGLNAQLAAGKGREPCVRVRGAGQATQDSGWFCSCPDRAAVTLMTPRDVAQALGCPEETGSSNSQCPVRSGHLGPPGTCLQRRHVGRGRGFRFGWVPGSAHAPRHFSAFPDLLMEMTSLWLLPTVPAHSSSLCRNITSVYARCWISCPPPILGSRPRSRGMCAWLTAKHTVGPLFTASELIGSDLSRWFAFSFCEKDRRKGDTVFEHLQNLTSPTVPLRGQWCAQFAAENFAQGYLSKRKQGRRVCVRVALPAMEYS